MDEIKRLEAIERINGSIAADCMGVLLSAIFIRQELRLEDAGHAHQLAEIMGENCPDWVVGIAGASVFGKKLLRWVRDEFSAWCKELNDV